MGGKAQEADRVRMERALLGAGMDAKRALERAARVAPYDERLRAWEALATAASRAHQALAWYMTEYGLMGKEGE